MASKIKVDTLETANGSGTITSSNPITVTGALTATTLVGDGSALTGVSAGKVLQVANFQTGAYASGTVIMPYDDTIPQITEGDEYMTLAITPTSATSRLRIDIVAMTTTNAANVIMQGALFVGTTADALASWQYDRDSVNGQGFGMLSGNHNMVAGVTTELTFRVRIGGDAAATTSFNGYVGLRRHGGVMASSITITEYTP